MHSNLVFLTFNEFKQALGSWEKPLGKFVDSKAFQDIYKFVKEEYESGKKVTHVVARFTPKWKTSLMPLPKRPSLISKSSLLAKTLTISQIRLTGYASVFSNQYRRPRPSKTSIKTSLVIS